MSLLLVTPVVEEKPFVVRPESPVYDMGRSDTDSEKSLKGSPTDDYHTGVIQGNYKNEIHEVKMKGEIEEEGDKESQETLVLEKRLRNKLAARRCRQKQKERIEYLEKDVRSIEKENNRVHLEIKDLQYQLDEMKYVLFNHRCILKSDRETKRVCVT